MDDNWGFSLLAILSFFLFVFLFAYAISLKVQLWVSRRIAGLKTVLSALGVFKGKAGASLEELVEAAGYAYDVQQDIFYSVLNPWQRKFGYCRPYDEAAAPMGMIIDCEPVYFEYDGRKWLIEFWKGQYDLTTGCEIGIYTSNRPDLNIPGVFSGTFYDCAEEKDFLPMACTLKKNGRPVFTRRGLHWWLTGFRLGEFSWPSELTMYIRITLKDSAMRGAFLKGLRETGYAGSEFSVKGSTVTLVFSDPHSPQPHSRTAQTDEIIQRKNRFLCDRFKEVTRGCGTLQEKLMAVKDKAPELLDHITGLGRPKPFYDLFGKIGGDRDE